MSKGLTAVVGGREDGDEGPLVPELVAVLDDHVRSTDKVNVVCREELVDLTGRRQHVESDLGRVECSAPHDALAEAVRHASLVVLPVQGGIGRVAPEQVVELCRRERTNELAREDPSSCERTSP